jgi:OOP family OmpA-OmpF porin
MARSELLSLLASRSSSAGFIQIIRVGAASGAPVVAADAPGCVAFMLAATMTGDLAHL